MKDQKAEEDNELTPKVVRERYDKGLDVVRAKLQDYWLNDAFVRGDQWIWYNPTTETLAEFPRDSDRVQATLNRMWPNSRTIVAKTMQRELQFEVIPSGGDDSTVRGARTSEAILRSVRGPVSHDWERLKEQFVWLTWKGGTGAICVDWDPNIGDPVANVDAVDAATPATRTGDTIEEALSISEFVTQPGVKNPEKGAYWIKARALPPEYVKAYYGLSEIPQGDVTANANLVQRKLESATGANNQELCLVLTYYERPNPMRPEGAVAVVIGEQFVDGPKKWPFPWKDRLNIAIGVETIDENSGYGSTILSDARSVQVALNATWSSIIEHVKLASNARLAVPHSSMDFIDQLTDLPGEVLPFADGMATPFYLNPGDVSQTAVLAMKELQEQLDDVMGVHDVSRGVAPTNIESGLGVSILIEQDSTPVGRLVGEISRVFSRVASMVLKLYEKNVTETRTSVIANSTKIPETIHWTGKDLSGQTTAHVPMDAIVPRNRAAQVAIAEKMAQMGLITTVEDFTRFADMPDQSYLIDAMNPHAAKARRENHEFDVGRQPITSKYDDHAIHIKEHTEFIISPKFDTLPLELQKFIEDHLQGHETLAAEAMGRQKGKMELGGPLMGMVPTADGAPQLSPEAALMTPGGGLPPAPPEGGAGDPAPIPPGLGSGEMLDPAALPPEF